MCNCSNARGTTIHSTCTHTPKTVMCTTVPGLVHLANLPELTQPASQTKGTFTATMTAIKLFAVSSFLLS
jgi:hypothetical protein